MFSEIYFILGLSGRARILSLFQVPTRFVWHLPDFVLGEICFIFGLSGRALILNFFQVPTWFVWQLPDSCSVKFILFYFGPFWPGSHTEFASGAN